MKKSDLYKLAEIAVMKYYSIDTETKLDILRVLFSDHDTALWSESLEEKENEKIMEDTSENPEVSK